MATAHGRPAVNGLLSQHRRLSALLFLVAVGAFVTEARAEDSVADKTAAQSLFDQAKELMATNQFGAACPKLEESQRLDPTSGTLINLADCYERLGRLASAWSTFLQAASSANAGGRFEREQVARARAAALEPRLPKIVIHVANDAANIELRRDGMPVDKRQWGTPIPVDLGQHRVSASSGNKTWEQVVSIQFESETQVVDVPPLEVPPLRGPAETRALGGQRVVALASGAVGVAGLIVGTAFGLESHSKHSEADQHCAGSSCRDQTGVDLRADAKRAGNLSTAGFIVGALGLGAGAALWLTVPNETSRPPVARVGIGFGNVALTATW